MTELGAARAIGRQELCGNTGKWLCWFAATVLMIVVIDGPRIRWQDWEVTPKHNINLAEAHAWHEGTFELPGFQREAANFGGRKLNAFPPGFTFISYAVLLVSKELTGAPSFPPWVFRILIGAPITAITFWAARTCTTGYYQAALLTLCVLLGTPLLPMLTLCRVGGFFEVNHVLASCGILLIAGDTLGRRRVWPALIGLALSVWTRQLTVFYLPAVVWTALHLPRGRREKWVAASSVTTFVLLGTYGALNWAKFGSALESGYRFIYEGRTDAIAERARRGLFRPDYVGENMRFMVFEPPGIRITSGGVVQAKNDHGASVFLTCPVLLAVVLTAPRWWQDPARRQLMLLSLGVMLALLMYHNTGWRQPGYYRFSLDFVPVWLMVIAPYLWGRNRTPLVVACVAWSIWYFRFITFGNLAWTQVPG